MATPAKSKVIVLPNPNLRKKSFRVGLITPEIRQIIDDMKKATINWDQSRDHEVGVALAAVQINQLFKIVIVRNNYDNKEDLSFTTFINPVITKLEGETEEDFEGCLSIVDIYGKVPRYHKARIKAINESGKTFRVTAEGFLARIFQHEIDHLKGILFIDHIKNNPEAFYKLQTDGTLEQINYKKHVQNSKILWKS